MFLDRSRGLRTLHGLFQALAAMGLFWVWTLVIFNDFTGASVAGYQYYFAYSLLVGLGVVIDSMRPARAKIDLLNLSLVKNCAISLRQTATVVAVLLLFLVAFKDQAISRLFLFSFIPSLFFLLFYSNSTFPLGLARFVFSGRYVQNTVLLSSNRDLERVRRWLERKASYGVRMVGLVTDQPLEGEHGGLPFLGVMDDLEGCIRRAEATQVIAVGLPVTPEIYNRVANTCQCLGVRLLIVNDLELILGRPVTMVEEDGIHFISFHREPLESPTSRIMKRLLDLAIAIPVVLFVLPVASLVVWLLHRWQSPGPLFFCQLRTGMQDGDFMLYKFRSMAPDTRNQAVQATEDDRRVFPAGRRLRKFSMDELPQFINVIKGEMSIVGPRPHLREHDQIFKQKMVAYGVRSFIKPGITGLAQVRDLRGEIRTDRDVIARVECDLEYLENWSLLLDITIILRTVWKVICPSKAAH